MSKEVEVQATYVGDQPLLSVLEANLDLERVSVRRTEYAVKAIVPIDVIFTSLSLHAFEKLVLDPLLVPIAEKFNWVTATKRLLKPHQPFNITVRIRDASFIEAPIGLDHALLADVWRILRRTIDILRDEALLEDTTLIRITSDRSGSPLVIGYRGARPSVHVLVSEGRTQAIPGRGQEPE